MITEASITLEAEHQQHGFAQSTEFFKSRGDSLLSLSNLARRVKLIMYASVHHQDLWFGRVIKQV